MCRNQQMGTYGFQTLFYINQIKRFKGFSEMESIKDCASIVHELKGVRKKNIS